MKPSASSQLDGGRLLKAKFSQTISKTKMFSNLYDNFGKTLEKKLAQEEEEMCRVKDNVSNQSQDPSHDNYKFMEEEPLAGDQAEIENDEITDQVGYSLTLGEIRY